MSEGKILIIDDDVDFSQATSRILENKKYEVIIASNAREARLMLKKEKPDLIILDIMLPDLDGFSLCTEIKQNTDFFEIPILILTSVSDKASQEKYAEKIALYHNADEFVEKPIDPKELTARVHGLLSRSKAYASEPTGKKKILFIDNNHDFMRSMREFLEEKDYEVETTDTGKGGIMMVKIMAPNLIIIDPILADLDGFSVCRELKSNPNTFNIPILMVTDFNQQLKEPDFARILAANHKVDEFIPKPIKPEQLLEKIQKYA